jgi:predicted nucleic acid-binding protein
MKILLDTNVILDVLDNREPFVGNAKIIMEKGRTGEISCAFTANAVADIFYISSKSRNRQVAKAILSLLVTTYDVISVTQEDCIDALALPNEDFEDALVEVCARKTGADFVISRDEDFIAAATAARVIKPDEFIAKII